jgi:hypothetical protein
MTTTPYEPNPAKAISDCKSDINKLAMECEIAKSAFASALIHIEALLAHLEREGIWLEGCKAPSDIKNAFDFLNAAKFKNGKVS